MYKNGMRFKISETKNLKSEINSSEKNQESIKALYGNKADLNSQFGVPLPDLLRPKSIQGLYGQKQLEKFKNKTLFQNLILFGPPGSGKTSFAFTFKENNISNNNQIANKFKELNAVEVGAKLLKETCDELKDDYSKSGLKTILFIDEIHRLNKSTQDVLLSYLEKGYLILIGATTENPYFELNSALLSRSRIIEFTRLDSDSLKEIVQNACNFINKNVDTLLTSAALNDLIGFSDGDARKLLNSLELVFHNYELENQKYQWPMSSQKLFEVLDNKNYSFDKKGNYHYEIVSALIKSIRGSDPSASVYYLSRLLEGGEDLNFIARRLIILASEDIGLADPKALGIAVDAFKACEIVGMPESRIILSNAVIYLATAPKSNSSYVAIQSALAEIKKSGALPVPAPLTTTNKLFDNPYKYPHDYPKNYVDTNYLPTGIKEKSFYTPLESGYEKHIKSFLNWLKQKL